MLCSPPPPSTPLQYIQLLCEYTKPLGELVPPRLTWTLNYWKTTLRSHVYKGFPFINLSTTPIFAYLTYLVARCKTFRLAEYTNHLVIKSASTKMGIKLLENIFKLPCYAGPTPLSPFTTHTTTVWILGTTWWVNPASTDLDIELLKNNFKLPCL